MAAAETNFLGQLGIESAQSNHVVDDEAGWFMVRQGFVWCISYSAVFFGMGAARRQAGYATRVRNLSSVNGNDLHDHNGNATLIDFTLDIPTRQIVRGVSRVGCRKSCWKQS